MNEEFMPQPTFNKLQKAAGFKCTIDCMATKANAKCKKFIQWQDDKITVSNCIAFDFLNTLPRKLVNERLYIFPPKNCLTKTAVHVFKHFKNTKFIFVFHKIYELPLGCEKLLSLPKAHLVKLAPTQDQATVLTFFPSEKRVTLELDNKDKYLILGTPNVRPRATFAIINMVDNINRCITFPKIVKIFNNIK